MADASFVFKRFKWDEKAYNAFKSSDEVESMLIDAAFRIVQKAEDLSGEQYDFDETQSARFNRPYAVVRTASPDAEEENAANNTLLKSIDAGRLQ